MLEPERLIERRVARVGVRGQKKLVIASTSEVYGKNDQVQLKEDDDGIFGPTTCTTCRRRAIVGVND